MTKKTTSFEIPTLSSANIVRVLMSDQRQVLIRKVRSMERTRCPDCGTKGEWKFGYVFITGTNQLTGITAQCQECAGAWAYMFEPVDALTLKEVKV